MASDDLLQGKKSESSDDNDTEPNIRDPITYQCQPKTASAISTCKKNTIENEKKKREGCKKGR